VNSLGAHCHPGRLDVRPTEFAARTSLLWWLGAALLGASILAGTAAAALYRRSRASDQSTAALTSTRKWSHPDTLESLGLDSRLAPSVTFDSAASLGLP
jgi:hypothetical protein